jgi:hypothetical protein
MEVFGKEAKEKKEKAGKNGASARRRNSILKGLRGLWLGFLAVAAGRGCSKLE